MGSSEVRGGGRAGGGAGCVGRRDGGETARAGDSETARGETARGETARGETARGETARGETARGATRVFDRGETARVSEDVERRTAWEAGAGERSGESGSRRMDGVWAVGGRWAEWCSAPCKMEGGSRKLGPGRGRGRAGGPGPGVAVEVLGYEVEAGRGVECRRGVAVGQARRPPLSPLSQVNLPCDEGRGRIEVRGGAGAAAGGPRAGSVPLDGPASRSGEYGDGGESSGLERRGLRWRCGDGGESGGWWVRFAAAAVAVAVVAMSAGFEARAAVVV